MVVYQHEADKGCSRTHLHFLMLGCQVDDEALKRDYKKIFPDDKRKGNDLWAWTHKDWQKENPGKQYDLGFIGYMSEGELRPKFVKNIPDEIIEEQRSKWIPTPKAVQSSLTFTKDDKEIKKYDEYKSMLADFAQAGVEANLDKIRSWTIRWYWKRDGRLPNAISYKRNAGSLYLWLLEEKPETSGPTFEMGIDQLKNLWY